MRIAARALIIVGLLITVSGVWAPRPFDFAIGLMNGWHLTVFPPPPFLGVLFMLSGVVALVARCRSARPGSWRR